jgi:hypothetical protein
MASKSFLARSIAVGAAVVALGSAEPAHAALKWKGFDWNVTDGGMAGVAEGDPANVSLDSDGYLHLNIKKNGSVWTASELFTTQKLGFGTYQWQIDGPVDTFDKQIVLGLFPYGPAAGIGDDGTNEIDIEWARWGYETGTNVGFTNYPDSGSTVGTKSYDASLAGSTESTARFTWTREYIESSVLKGYQALSSDTGLLAKWKYAPSNASTNIPQQALPLGINLWCFDAPPSDGKEIEIVIRDFQFIPEGEAIPDGEGSAGDGAGGAGGASGSSGSSEAGAPSAPQAGGSSGVAGQAGTSGSPSAGGKPVSSAGSANGGSPSGTAGVMSSAGAASDAAPSEDAGCGCRVASAPERRGSLVGVAAALCGSVLLRRRRRRCS